MNITPEKLHILENIIGGGDKRFCGYNSLMTFRTKFHGLSFFKNLQKYFLGFVDGGIIPHAIKGN